MDEAAEPLVSEEDRNFVPGDLVWGKLKNHQWWPGLVVDPSFNSTIEGFDTKTKESYLLVDFFESTMASTWCKVSELRPFVSDYKIVILASRSSRRGSGFSSAMEKALEELRRRIEVKMMCESAPDEARRKLDGPGELRTYGQSIVDGLGTDVFLQMYYDAACDVSSVDLLDSVVMQGWIAAFFRETGRYVSLPVYHMFEGIENFGEVKVKAKKERSMAELIAETDLEADNYEDEALVKVNVVEDVRRSAGRKRKKKREEDDNDNHDEGDGDDEQEEEEEEERTVEQLQDAASDNDDDGDDVRKEGQHGTGRRERKKSKYLSPPYTMMNSRTIVKCNKKTFVFDHGASADELLSEFRLVALDTMYLVDHQDDNIIRGFFDRFRNSVFISGSYFEEYNSKCLDSSDGGDAMTSPSSESDMFSLEGKPGGFQIVKDNGISKSKTRKQMKSPVSKENGDADDKLRSPGFDVNDLLTEARQNSYAHEGNDLAKGTDAVEGEFTESGKRKSMGNDVNGFQEVRRRGRPRKKPINAELTKTEEAKSADSANKTFRNEKIDEISSGSIASSRLETNNIDPSNQSSSSQTLSNPPLHFVKKSLEDMIVTINDSVSRGEDVKSPELKPDVRENLVDEMSGLLTKVNKIMNSPAPAPAPALAPADAEGNPQ